MQQTRTAKNDVIVDDLVKTQHKDCIGTWCTTTLTISTFAKQLKRTRSARQQLQRGSAMSCSISSILFTVAFEMILIGEKQMATGVRSQSEATWMASRPSCRLRLATTSSWSSSLGQERSLLIWKGGRSDNILLLAEQPVKNLGRVYTPMTSQTHSWCSSLKV